MSGEDPVPMEIDGGIAVGLFSNYADGPAPLPYRAPVKKRVDEAAARQKLKKIIEEGLLKNVDWNRETTTWEEQVIIMKEKEMKRIETGREERYRKRSLEAKRILALTAIRYYNAVTNSDYELAEEESLKRDSQVMGGFFVHINFKARPEGSDHEPKLFFAELVENNSGFQEVTCCSVLDIRIPGTKFGKCTMCRSYHGILHPLQGYRAGAVCTVVPQACGGHPKCLWC